MNVPHYLLTFAHLLCAAAATGASRVSVERQLLEEGIRSGRGTCRLYCRVGIGFHLQIHPDGRVNGSHEPNQLSVLELFAVSQGVIGIRGVYSNRFLAMNKRGRLHATEWFTDDCKFRERSRRTATTPTPRSSTGTTALDASGSSPSTRGARPKWAPVHGSSPSTCPQHFLPRVGLHDNGERGFTITDKSKERRKTPPPPPLTPRANVHAGTIPRRTQVKYWPKYRFG
uniref:Fibroblast growth factor n=1 Tax=Sphaeramia orbicularis TaxID=375764 RepID=A0A672Y4M2_9TELE